MQIALHARGSLPGIAEQGEPFVPSGR